MPAEILDGRVPGISREIAISRVRGYRCIARPGAIERRVRGIASRNCGAEKVTHAFRRRETPRGCSRRRVEGQEREREREREREKEARKNRKRDKGVRGSAEGKKRGDNDEIRQTNSKRRSFTLLSLPIERSIESPSRSILDRTVKANFIHFVSLFSNLPAILALSCRARIARGRTRV